MFKSKKYCAGFIFALVVLIAYYLYWQNNSIEVSYYTIFESELPIEFDGFKIVHISDTHNKDFGSQLSEKIIDEEPDVIFMTGDLVDRNRTDIPVAVATLEDVVDVAPIYFVSGNHEMEFGQYKYLKTELDRIGVLNLDNRNDYFSVEDSRIGLLGIHDPMFITPEEIEEAGSAAAVFLAEIDRLLSESTADFNILLSHRAELMSHYVNSNIDLVFSGHAHGGQIRLPFLNGLFAPSQGFMPVYTSGVYEESETKMVVSRGLGNSIFPFRINNRPELVVVTLNSQ